MPLKAGSNKRNLVILVQSTISPIRASPRREEVMKEHLSSSSLLLICSHGGAHRSEASPLSELSDAQCKCEVKIHLRQPASHSDSPRTVT